MSSKKRSHSLISTSESGIAGEFKPFSPPLKQKTNDQVDSLSMSRLSAYKSSESNDGVSIKSSKGLKKPEFNTEISRDKHSPPSTPTNPPSLGLATPTASQSTSPSETSGYEEYVGDSKIDNLLDPLYVNRQKCKMDLKEILSHQFDLEILLKHHELKSIEDEIAKVHVMMLKMRRSSKKPVTGSISDEPTYFTDLYAKYLGKDIMNPSSARYNQVIEEKPATFVQDSESLDESSYQAPVTRSKSSLKKTDDSENSSKRCFRRKTEHENKPEPGKVQCIIRRNDGILVRLICPKCNRENFFSPQGFINHCRISHSLEFTSHDAAAVVCGVEIEVQDEIGLTAQKTMESKKKMDNSTTGGKFSKQKTIPFNTEDEIFQNNKIFMRSIPETKIIDTNNLAAFLEKNHVDVDLKTLVKKSMENYPKAYLLDNEEDDQDVELGDEATPFERALVEARKMKLNVEEIQKSGSSSLHLSNSRQNRKKRGGLRGRKVRNPKPIEKSNQKQLASLAPSESGSKPVKTVTGTTKPSAGKANSECQKIGGKYRPGTAPLHWSSIVTDSSQDTQAEEDHETENDTIKCNNGKDEADQQDKMNQGKILKFLPLSRFF